MKNELTPTQSTRRFNAVIADLTIETEFVGDGVDVSITPALSENMIAETIFLRNKEALQVSCESGDHKDAAVATYMESIGARRRAKLAELNAPAQIQKFERCVESIKFHMEPLPRFLRPVARQFMGVQIGPQIYEADKRNKSSMWIMDNMTQQWVIFVEEVENMVSADTQ